MNASALCECALSNGIVRAGRAQSASMGSKHVQSVLLLIRMVWMAPEAVKGRHGIPIDRMISVEDAAIGWAPAENAKNRGEIIDVSFAGDLFATHEGAQLVEPVAVLAENIAKNASRMSRLANHLFDILALTKPRVISLVGFTALVGLLMVPGHALDYRDAIGFLCILTGAGAAGALNMWFDADIDAVMARTSQRPIPTGHVSKAEALIFGVTLALASTAVMARWVGSLAGLLLGLTIWFYAVVYTMILKRQTPQSIVLGGAAGAAAPVIGWVVAAGQVSLEPMLPAFIIFMWTPPHFWALSVIRTGDYARAAVPALPVVSGTQNTTQQILFYTLGLAVASVLPWLFGFSGFFYGITALVLDTIFLALALSLHRNAQQKRNHARKMFAFSILYLFAIFAALLLDIILRPAVRSFLPL